MPIQIPNMLVPYQQLANQREQRSDNTYRYAALKQSGDIATDNQAIARDRIAADEQQNAVAQIRTIIAEKLKFLSPIIDSMVQSGDSEGLNKLVTFAQGDEHLKQVIPHGLSVSVSPKKEVILDYVEDVQAGSDAKDPLGRPLPPGKWKIKMNDSTGQVLSAEPYSDPNEQKILDRELRRSEGEANRALRRDINEGNQALRQDLSRGNVYPTAFVDSTTGVPLVIDRQGNIRPATMAQGVTPSIKPSSSDVSQESALYDMQQASKRVRTSWKPKYTGAGQAVIGSAGEWIGITPAEQVQFNADLKSMRDALLRAKSGAQINEQEYRRLKNILPDEYKADKSFIARLDRFDKELNDIVSGRGRAKRGLGATPVNTPSRVGRFTIEVEK